MSVMSISLLYNSPSLVPRFPLASFVFHRWIGDICILVVYKFPPLILSSSYDNSYTTHIVL